MKTAEKAPGAGAVEVEPNKKRLDRSRWVIAIALAAVWIIPLIYGTFFMNMSLLEMTVFGASVGVVIIFSILIFWEMWEIVDV